MNLRQAHPLLGLGEPLTILGEGLVGLEHREPVLRRIGQFAAERACLLKMGGDLVPFPHGIGLLRLVAGQEAFEGVAGLVES